MRVSILCTVNGFQFTFNYSLAVRKIAINIYVLEMSLDRV